MCKGVGSSVEGGGSQCVTGLGPGYKLGPSDLVCKGVGSRRCERRAAYSAPGPHLPVPRPLLVSEGGLCLPPWTRGGPDPRGPREHSQHSCVSAQRPPARGRLLDPRPHAGAERGRPKERGRPSTGPRSVFQTSCLPSGGAGVGRDRSAAVPSVPRSHKRRPQSRQLEGRRLFPTVWKPGVQGRGTSTASSRGLAFGVCAPQGQLLRQAGRHPPWDGICR